MLLKRQYFVYSIYERYTVYTQYTFFYLLSHDSEIVYDYPPVGESSQSCDRTHVCLNNICIMYTYIIHTCIHVCLNNTVHCIQPSRSWTLCNSCLASILVQSDILSNHCLLVRPFFHTTPSLTAYGEITRYHVKQ